MLGRTLLLAVLLLVGGTVLAQQAKTSGGSGSANIEGLNRSHPTFFEENVGQFDPQVRFVARLPEATVFFRNDGVSKVISARNPQGDAKTELLSISWPGTNPDLTAEGRNKRKAYSNYLIGNNRDKWTTGVSHFSEVWYESVYSGINLRYYFRDGQLEYDFVVSPGADPSQIRVCYNGSISLQLRDDRSLFVESDLGGIVEERPVAYLDSGVEGRTPVVCEFALENENTINFNMPEGFDATRTLVIDPILLIGTYLGGSWKDVANGVCYDESGDIFVVGETQSTDFPDTAAYDSTLGGFPDIDVFVSKFDHVDGSLIFSTFVGGSGLEWANDVASYGGAAFVTGRTDNNSLTIDTFPTTPDAFVEDLQAIGGGSDVFVFKLSSDGQTLQYSTFMGSSLGSGGTTQEAGWAVDVDEDGYAYVAGGTNGSDFPDGSGSGQIGGEDAFLVKLNPDGTDIEFYDRVYPASGNDRPYDLVVDDSGNAYVIGETNSPNFPTTSGVVDSIYSGSSDAFVMKYSSAGTRLFSTFVGGSTRESGRGIAVSPSGSIYVTGYTDSDTLFGATGNSGDYDVFVSKLSNDGTSALSTRIVGGTGDDFGTGVAVAPNGLVYVVGSASDSLGSFPAPLSSSVDSINSSPDAFVLALKPGLVSPYYFSWIGGNGSDSASAIVARGDGAIAVVGATTSSSDFPLHNARQASFAGGGWDAFLAYLAPSNCCPEGESRGDINGDGNIGLTDVTLLNNHLFVTFEPVPCFEATDVNANGVVTLTDVTVLINYLFVTFVPPPDCPAEID
jgi:hypothetical protein